MKESVSNNNSLSKTYRSESQQIHIPKFGSGILYIFGSKTI